MKRSLGLILVSLLAAAAWSRAAEALLPRHPAPSPDGSRILFSWQGDIWVVPAAGGDARRLTVHPATDRHPLWSRDGRWIAFASTRHGGTDVFVAPSDGSEPPRRLTFASAGDTPLDFTPDGGGVLFASKRSESVLDSSALYTVPIEGGTPALAQAALGIDAAYSPEGKRLAFVRGRTPWWRHRYRGAANRDLWLRTAEGRFERLTRFEGDDDHPSWLCDHLLLFRSEREGRKNLFALDVNAGEARSLTRHEGSDVRFPRASADGSLVAYEFEDALWTVAPLEGKPRRLSIQVPADLTANPVERRTSKSGAGALAVRPDGKVAAFTVHGDVFVVPVVPKDDQEIAKPPTARVTATPGREKNLAWSPDGETLLFASDREGSFDLYLARPADEEKGWGDSFEFEIVRLTEEPGEEHSPSFSPDGERIAFLRGRGTLAVAELSGKDRLRKETTILDQWARPDYRWSPDGKWIAYSLYDQEYNSEIWIVPADGGEPYNVSRHPDEDTQPRWSPDGKRLVWRTKRHADTFDIWAVWLTIADHERRAEDWLRHWNDPGDKKDKKKKDDGEEEDEEEDKDKKKKELPEVAIDFDRLWERARSLTDMKGDESRPFVSKDGKTVYFTAAPDGERDLYSVRWDGKELERLTKDGKNPSWMQMDSKGKSIFHIASGGKIARMKLSGKSGDPIPFEARYEVDRAAEAAAAFDEGWRALGQEFYDPDFHGADWEAARETYRPWALAASHPSDFTDVVRLMLGELNASHTNYSGPRGGGGGESTGYIGALYDPAAGGPGLLVREVLPESPAARIGVELREGERILSVNGTEVGPDTNIYALFVDSSGRRVPIEIEGTGGRARSAVVVPISSWGERRLRYRKWVRSRREMVERLSEGRLGYLHIQGMNIPSFEEFERDLYAAGHGREGLVIDVRSNSGGWTTDYLLAVLEVRRHAHTLPRGGDPSVRAYPQERLRLAAWTKPAIALCNEESFSNAEILAHAFQTLDRGLVVGTRTFGGVISTGGTRLVNGGWIRLPLRGWYIGDTDVLMENNGAVPDIVVPQPPEQDTLTGEDDQLEEAVKALLAGLEADPRRGSW
jgi:tricorn protease